MFYDDCDGHQSENIDQTTFQIECHVCSTVCLWWPWWPPVGKHWLDKVNL